MESLFAGVFLLAVFLLFVGFFVLDLVLAVFLFSVLLLLFAFVLCIGSLCAMGEKLGPSCSPKTRRRCRFGEGVLLPGPRRFLSFCALKKGFRKKILKQKPNHFPGFGGVR